jgi:hypothetical protein
VQSDEVGGSALHGTAAPSSGPFTVRRYSRPGGNAYRILILGDQSPRDGRSGFGQALVNRLWLRSQHGLSVDVVASALIGLRSLRAAYASWRVNRYDAVVVVLPPHGFRTQKRAARALAAVLGRLLEHTSVTIASDEGELPATAARRRSRGRTHDIALTAEASTADAVAVQVDDQLRDLGDGARGSARSPGPASPGADSGAPAEPRIDVRLASIVSMVRESFAVDTAAINIFDGDDLWTIAAAGTDRGRRAREGSLCEETSDNPGLTVVPDVWSDPQLRMLDVAHGPVPIRFYAAYPLEPERGLRLGTLCIYDRRPRDPDGYDFTLLRDFAQLAEIEIAEAGRSPRAES